MRLKFSAQISTSKRIKSKGLGFFAVMELFDVFEGILRKVPRKS